MLCVLCVDVLCVAGCVGVLRRLVCVLSVSLCAFSGVSFLRVSRACSSVIYLCVSMICVCVCPRFACVCVSTTCVCAYDTILQADTFTVGHVNYRCVAYSVDGGCCRDCCGGGLRVPCVYCETVYLRMCAPVHTSMCL